MSLDIIIIKGIKNSSLNLLGHETCIVSIKMSNELQLIEINDENDQNQRFLTSATISDVYKQNKIDTEHQFLLYSNDFVP